MDWRLVLEEPPYQLIREHSHCGLENTRGKCMFGSKDPTKGLLSTSNLEFILLW